MSHPTVLSLLLHACSATADGDAAAGASCEDPVVTASGEPEPVVPLRLAVTAGDRDTFHWGVDGGTLSAEAGEQVEWTLPEDAAARLGESFTATVTASGGGCEEVVGSLVLDVDWTDAQRTVVIYGGGARLRRRHGSTGAIGGHLDSCSACSLREKSWSAEAEAAIESTRVGRWMMVWVGDPPYRPYPAGSSASAR